MRIWRLPMLLADMALTLSGAQRLRQAFHQI
jgi:hypothetical protein